MADNSSALKNVTQMPDWKRDSGPLKLYLTDETISEIMVNRWDEVFVERNGKIEKGQFAFQNPDSLLACVQAFCVFAGREANRRSPYVDARLPDGSRMNIVVPPVSFGGPVMTIRKAIAKFTDYRSLIKNGSLSEKAAYFLNSAVDARQNIIVSGGTGSGKTTLLSVLSSFIDGNQRVIAIEDTAELQLQVRNFVRLEIPPAHVGETPITMAELLRNALRMRPDRLIIGECRGPEALDMIMAMNTGHEGSMTSIHANRAIDTLGRMETMVLRSGIDVPNHLIQQNLGNTINFIVHMERAEDGRRRLDEILEIRGWDNGEYITETIFKWDPQMGSVSTGKVPKFAEKQSQANPVFPEGFFDPGFIVKLNTEKK